MKWIAIIWVLAGLLRTACARQTGPERPVVTLAEHDYFMMYPKPVLETRCLAYHRGKQPPAGLSLLQRSDLHAPRKRDRPYVIPGNPWASVWLTSVVSGGTHPLVAGGPLLSEGLISSLFEWIEDGAFWPDNPYGFLQPERPVLRKKGLLERQAPLIPNKAWCRAAGFSARDDASVRLACLLPR